MALSEKELLLLSNLMYCTDCLSAGDTVGETVEALLSSGNFEQFEEDRRENIRQVLEAIAADPNLTELTVAEETPEYSDIHAACFVDGEGNATVAFEGTDGTQYAWNDNFQGENKSDTTAQRQAEIFIRDVCSDYDNITVTGHSKGGNMAAYTAILCSSVSYCAAFDAQGFSDEFYSKYSPQVEANKSKITNFCASNDYVNPLLTSVNENKYLNNETNGIIGGHYPETLYLTNSGGDPYGDFEADCYTSQESIFAVESVGVSVISSALDATPSNAHQLVVDLIGVAASIALSNDYSLSEAANDIVNAVKRTFGLGQKYFSNAEYSIDLTGVDGCCDNLSDLASMMGSYKDQLNDAYNNFSATALSLKIQKFLLKKMVSEAESVESKLGKMASGLYGIRQIYTDTEIKAIDICESIN